MAEETKKPVQVDSELVGRRTEPTVLDSTTTLDIDTKKVLVDNIIDAGLSHQLDTAALENFTSISNARDQIYQSIDSMAQDSSVAAILRTYAEDVCETADNGHVVWCESNDPKISRFINYVLNVMNVDKNVYGWVYCLLKYGDVYLRLYRESDYQDALFKPANIDKAFSARNVLNEDLQESVNLNIRAANDQYSYYVEMVDDPSTMFELTKFGKTYGYIEVPNVEASLGMSDTYAGIGTGINSFNFRMKSADVNVWQADDFVHACLEDNFTRYPETVELFLNENDYKNNTHSQSYSVRRGKSLLYDSYKIWREKALLENAALLNRITRSSVVRKVAVEVGDMPKEQVQQTLRRVKDMMEQKSSFNAGKSMTEYNNPGPMENNIYFATHGGQGNITIDSVGGDVDVKNLADLDWWNNKFYSSYGIPKQYFGWTDDGAGFNGGTSLTILSSVYAKGIKRVQNAVIQAITDIINLILINKGLKSHLNNFTIKMKAPLTQEEIDYRSDLTNRISAISNLQSLFTDVEDKPRRLRILKTLVATLNYGDELLQEIDEEIKAVEEALAKEAEAAEAEAALEAEAAGEAVTETEVEEVPEEDDELDLNLDMPTESWKPAEGAVSLHEDTQEPLEESDFLTETDDLPSPSDIDPDRDFSENE
jgi:hypothetical protein